MLVATGVSKVESTKNTKKNYRVKISPNKLFKRDSQRVAFLLCVGFSGYGGMQQLQYCVAHPLTRR